MPRRKKYFDHDRGFGLLACASLLLLGRLQGLRETLAPFALGALSAAFLLLALLRPRALGPLHRAWIAFGNALSRLTQPVTLALFFFFVLTPFAVVLRLLGKNPMIARDAGVTSRPSHWIPRESPPNFENPY